MTLATKQAVKVGPRVVELTNLDKVLWPDEGITKADLIGYFAAVADRLLPHLKGRPLTLTRFPDGITGEMFYQKDTPDYAPSWIPTYSVFSSDSQRVIRYMLAEEAAALVWLGNQAAIEIHPWMSRTSHPKYPDYAVVDLDPAEGATWRDVTEIAALVGTLLEELGLAGFPKLSGATGIHIYIPLAPKYTYRQTSRFVGCLGELIAKAYPEKATNQRQVRNRTGKVYIDHLQNLPGKTIVAPYIPRPLPGAPVSVPIRWDELSSLTPQQFSITDVDAVLRRPGEFDAMRNMKQSLDQALNLFSHAIDR